MIALTGVFTFGTSPASAAAPKPVQVDLAFYQFVHGQTGKCLEGSVSVGIRLGTCATDNSYQLYLFEPAGWSTLASPHEYCVEAAASVGVRPGTCTPDNRYQQWRYYPATAQLQHLQSLLCLEASASVGVRLGTCSPSNANNTYQQWYLN
ncbi:RICIN domain-containing protein [Actinoplanes sp. NPDC051470]|uniref:RICIN domain-containing protein n=1 Tax=unclassified Actinoplanes TaxID=2626549 RepID=UPI00342BC7FF